MSLVCHYHKNASSYDQQYQSISFESVHSDWLSLLPSQPGYALDVGAGSGRDSKALSDMGWQVLAVEPAAGLRELGQDRTRYSNVTWIDDLLPGLSHVRTLSQRFELILVSAVWMHLRPEEQQRALRVLASLLAPGGMLVITYRGADSRDERQFFEVSLEAMDRWAMDLALLTLLTSRSNDRLGRRKVAWHLRVYRLPDDGTGSLPILRHVIVNDNKSSTYKLGLMRTLVRLADTTPGIVLSRNTDWVTLPLGAVGLYWLMLYRPLLLDYRLRQSPGSQGYGFAKRDFYALAELSPNDMRIGSQLKEPTAAATVLRSIRDACQIILKMPAHYITWPGNQRPIFEGGRSAMRIKEQPAYLDHETLAAFGTFKVPALLWDCMSRYACWLEPAIIHEWVQLMQGYNSDEEIGRLHLALRWPESRRDTQRVRQLVSQRLQTHDPLHCVWSYKDLHRHEVAIDHCFPWSRWQNNDLWNLLPVTARANNVKSDRLPAASLMASSRESILAWWDIVIADTTLATQFRNEAQAALPLITCNSSLDKTFDSVMIQRQRLKANQQLVEWMGFS